MTTSLHRRALLSGALTLPLATAGAAASPDHPDAALLALQPETDAAAAAWNARLREQTAAEKVYSALMPDKPKEPRTPKAAMDAFWAGNSGPLLAADKSNDAYDEAIKAWREATERAQAESGLKAAEEAARQADIICLTIRNEKIIPTRARTLDGLIFKARYADADSPGNPDEEVMRSIVDDLLALAEEAGAA